MTQERTAGRLTAEVFETTVSTVKNSLQYSILTNICPEDRFKYSEFVTAHVVTGMARPLV